MRKNSRYPWNSSENARSLKFPRNHFKNNNFDWYCSYLKPVQCIIYSWGSWIAFITEKSLITTVRSLQDFKSSSKFLGNDNYFHTYSSLVGFDSLTFWHTRCYINMSHADCEFVFLSRSWDQVKFFQPSSIVDMPASLKKQLKVKKAMQGCIIKCSWITCESFEQLRGYIRKLRFEIYLFISTYVSFQVQLRQTSRNSSQDHLNFS